VTAFKVRDLVGQPRLDSTSESPPGFNLQRYLRQEVQIEILSVEPDRITAKVTVLGDFFSSERLNGGPHGTSSFGFVLGETLTLTPGGGEDSWKIEEPRGRPWHILSCRDGNKTFEHYR